MRLVPALLVPLTAACAPAFDVDGAREVGAIQSEHVVGRDGGASVLVGDSDVWIFGDSFVDTADADGRTFHSSSSAVTGDLRARDGLDDFAAPLDDAGSPLRFLDETADEHAFNLAHLDHDGACDEDPCGARNVTWPGTTVHDVVGDRFITFYQRIHAEPGDYNFHGTGTSLAFWSTLEERPQRVEPPLFAEDEPAFGTAAAVGDDGLLYAFACDSEGLSTPCKLARVAPADAGDRAQWTFYDGGGYVDDLARAASVLDGAPIMTLAKSAHLHAWLVVYSAPLSSDVVARVADAIEGPWSAPVKLFTADHADDGNVYDAYLHPELAGGDGAHLVVSYSRADGTFFGSVTVLEDVALR